MKMQNWEVLFAQKLAANEKNVRDKAVKKLGKWISAKTSSKSSGFSKIEIAKVWKGLFYCMWMSDKPVVQEELANTISNLIHCFGNAESALVFIDGCFETMGREWDGIDVWRLDKFMNFVRKFLGKCLEFLGRLEWEEELVHKFLEVIFKDLLNPNATTASLGLRMHFSDIFIEEVAKNAYSKISPEKLTIFFIPFCNCLAMTKPSPLTQTIVTRVFEFALRLHEKDMELEGQEEQTDEETDASDSSEEEDEDEDQDENECEDQEEDEDEDQEEDEPDLGLKGNWTRKLKKHELEARSIPFPKFDFKNIGDAINKIALDSNTKYHKECLVRLADSYWKMSRGIFDLDDFMVPTDKRLKAKDFSNAAERLVDDETNDRIAKLRLKKAARKQLKQQRQMDSQPELNGDAIEMFDDFDDADFGDDHLELEKTPKKRQAPAAPECEPVTKKSKTATDKSKKQKNKSSSCEPETEESEQPKPVVDKLMLRLLAKSASETARPATNETPRKKNKSAKQTTLPVKSKCTNGEVVEMNDEIPTLVPIANHVSATVSTAISSPLTVSRLPFKAQSIPDVINLDSDNSDIEAVNGDDDDPEIVFSDCSPPQSVKPASEELEIREVEVIPDPSVTSSRKKSRSNLKSQTNRYFAPEGTTLKKRRRISGLSVDASGAFVLEKVSRKSKNRKNKLQASGEFLSLAFERPIDTPKPTPTKVKLSPVKPLVKFEKVSPSTPAFFRMATSKLASKSLPKKKKQQPVVEESPAQLKKVNFLLSKNVAHADGEYLYSVKNSPSLPFDAKKTPTQGVLKVKSKQVTPAPRRRAMDFF